MWQDIKTADKGKYVTRTNTNGREYQMFDHIRIIGGNDTWVGETYWTPPGELSEGRWNVFAIDKPPTKWQPLPVFPTED